MEVALPGGDGGGSLLAVLISGINTT